MADVSPGETWWISQGGMTGCGVIVSDWGRAGMDSSAPWRGWRAGGKVVIHSKGRVHIPYCRGTAL